MLSACCLCGAMPVEAHHVAGRAVSAATVPLCRPHHRRVTARQARAGALLRAGAAGTASERYWCGLAGCTILIGEWLRAVAAPAAVCDALDTFTYRAGQALMLPARAGPVPAGRVLPRAPSPPSVRPVVSLVLIAAAVARVVYDVVPAASEVAQIGANHP